MGDVAPIEGNKKMAFISLNTAAANGTAAVAAALAAPTDTAALLATQKASAIAIVAALDGAEGAVINHVKAWGLARAIQQFKLNVDAASLDKADKSAIGWKELAAGSPGKRRLSQYHSRFRKIAEEYATIPEVELTQMFAGERSFLSVYDNIVKREKEAEKLEKEKAEAAAAAAAAAANIEAATEGEGEGEGEGEPADLSSMAIALGVAYCEATPEARAAARAALADMIEAINLADEADAEGDDVSETIAAAA